MKVVSVNAVDRTRLELSCPTTLYESWPRQMGQRRRKRDEEAAREERVRASDEREGHALCLQRWPGVVAALRTLIASYNEGAATELLIVTERWDGENPAVVVESTGRSCSSLAVAVDGANLCVRIGSAECAADAPVTERRIDCSRSDIGTAAYVLQDWMDRL